MTAYNDRRDHQTLRYRTPTAVFENPAPACGKVGNAVVPLRFRPVLPTFPQTHRHEKGESLFWKRRGIQSRCDPLTGGGLHLVGVSLSQTRFLSNGWAPPHSVPRDRAYGSRVNHHLDPFHCSTHATGSAKRIDRRMREFYLDRECRHEVMKCNHFVRQKFIERERIFWHDGP